MWRKDKRDREFQESIPTEDRIVKINKWKVG